MNKTVIKKHTAMSTVLFKRFTSFVIGVISILVLSAGNVSAQNVTLSATQTTNDKCSGKANLSISISGTNYRIRNIKYSINGGAQQTTNNTNFSVSGIALGGENVSVKYDIQEYKLGTDGNYSWVTTKTNQTSNSVYLANNKIRLGGGGTVDICGSSVTLTGTALPWGAQGQWSGTGITGNQTNNVITINNVPAGSGNQYTWKATANGCSSSETFTVNNHVNETVAFTMNKDLAVCGTTTSAGIGVTAPGASVYWEPSNKVTNPDAATTTAINLDPGVNTFTAHISKGQGCPEQTGTIKVYRYDASASASAAFVCADDEDIELRATQNPTFPTGTTTEWIPNGSGTITTGKNNSQVATAHISGSEVFFTYHVNIPAPVAGSSGCTLDIPTAKITKEEVNADIEKEYCIVQDDSKNQDGYNLVAAEPKFQGGYTGLWEPVSGQPTTITNADQPVASFKYNDNLHQSHGVTTFKWTATSNNNPRCKETTTVKIVKLYSAFDISTDLVCSKEDVVQLTAEDPAPGTGVWTPAQSISFADPNAYVTVASNIGGTGGGSQSEHEIQWKVTYKSKNGGTCTATASKTIVSLNVESVPGAAQEVCTNTATMQAGTLPSTTPATTGQWNYIGPNVAGAPAIVITNTADPKTTVNNLHPGANEFSWTVTRKNADGSKVCTDTKSVIIYNSEVSDAEAGDPQSICYDHTTLGATPPADGEGLWDYGNRGPNTVIVDPTNPNTEVTGLKRGRNNFSWTVYKGVLSPKKCHKVDYVDVFYMPIDIDAGNEQMICDNQTNFKATGNPGAYMDENPNIEWKAFWEPIAGANSYVITPSTAQGTAEQVLPVLSANVAGITKGKHSFRLNLQIIDKTTGNVICSEYDDVDIWNDQVGVVSAGMNDITCGDPFSAKKASTGSADLYHSWYEGNYRYLNGTPPPDANYWGEWTNPAGGATIANPNSYQTSVSNLQRYSQETRPDYWTNNPTVNVFTWTLHYKNPDTQHECYSSADVEIIWLAPFDADAGDNQLVCGKDVNLNAEDEGAGAMFNWWTSSTAASNTNNLFYQNPYWGGKAVLVENHQGVDVSYNVNGVSGRPAGTEATKKDVFVYEDKVEFEGDGKTYVIISTRTVYYNPGSQSGYDRNNNALVSGVDIKYQYYDASTYVDYEHRGAEVTPPADSQAAAYQIADEIYNMSVNGQQTAATPANPSITQYRWYKANRLVDPYHTTQGGGEQKVVTCLVYDDTEVKVLGLMSDVNAGSEAAICDDEYQLAAVGWETIKPNGSISDYSVSLVEQSWSVVHGHGTFVDVHEPSSVVQNMSYDTNIYRWTVIASIKSTNSNGQIIQGDNCIMSDDVYITNAQPAVPALPADREVCQRDHINLKGNLPVRGDGFWHVRGGTGIITHQSCKDATCDAFVDNLSWGENLFEWQVVNKWESKKNPSQVFIECSASVFQRIYYHGMDAEASPDQFLCSDEAELNGSLPDVGDISPVELAKYGAPHGWWVTRSGVAKFYNYDNTLATPSGINVNVYASHVILKHTPRSNYTTVWWHVKWGGCENSKEVRVFNNLPYNSPSTGPTQDVCEDYANLTSQNVMSTHNNFSSTTPPPTVTSKAPHFQESTWAGKNSPMSYNEWTSTSNNVTFNDALNGTTVANNLNKPGLTELYLTFYNKNVDWQNDPNGNVNPIDNTKPVEYCFIEDKLQIYNNSVTTYAGLDQTLCGYPQKDNYATLAAQNVPTNAEGEWSVIGGTGSEITFFDKNLNTTKITVVNGASGDYTLNWRVRKKNGNNNTEPWCYANDQVVVTMNVPDTAIAQAFDVNKVLNRGNIQVCDDDVDLHFDREYQRGEGVWTSTSDGIIKYTPNNSATDLNVTKLPINSTVFTLTIDYHGCKSIDTIEVFNNKVVAIAETRAGRDPHVIDICEDSYKLSANNYALNDGDKFKTVQKWSCSHASVQFKDNSSPNASVTGLVRSQNKSVSNHLVWTVTKGKCSTYDYIDVYNNKFEIEDKPNFIVCENTATLEGEAPGTQNSSYYGVWKVERGGSQFTSNASSNTVTVGKLQKKENEFSWTVFRNGCSAEDRIIVFNNEVEAKAGDDINTCDETVKLQGVKPEWGIGTWTVHSASGSPTFGETSLAGGLSEMTVFNGYVFGLKQGETVLKWTVKSYLNDPVPSSITNPNGTVIHEGKIYEYAKACIDEDFVSIHNDMPDDPEVIEPNVEICQEQTAAGLDVLLKAKEVRAASGGTSWGEGHWEYYSGPTGGVIVTPSDNESKIDNLPYGESVYAWVVEKTGSNGLVCRKADYVHVFNNYVEAELNNAYDEVCEPKTNLYAKDPADRFPGATGVWSYQNFSNIPAADCPVIAQATDPSTQVTSKLPSGRSNFVWTVKKGSGKCHAEVIYSVDNNMVEAEIASPALNNNELNIHNSYEICKPDELRLIAKAIPNAATGTWTLDQKPSGFDMSSLNIASPNGLVTDVKGLYMGNSTYVFKWSVQIGTGKCNRESDITITNNGFTVDADQSIDTKSKYICGPQYTLNPETISGTTGTWTAQVILWRMVLEVLPHTMLQPQFMVLQKARLLN